MKRTIVFIHGWGFDHQMWDKFIKQYFFDYDVQTICFFDHFHAYLNLEKCLENICDCISESIKPNSLIVGWSLGAMISLRLSARLIDKNHMLCLFCFNPCFVKKSGWEYGIDKEQLELMITDLSNDKVSTLNRFYALITYGSTRQKESLATIKHINRYYNMSTEKLLFGLELLKEMDLIQDIENSKVPITLCYAEKDPLVNKNIYNDMPFINKKIQYVLLSKSDHIPFISSPSLAADAIFKTLNEHV